MLTRDLAVALQGNKAYACTKLRLKMETQVGPGSSVDRPSLRQIYSKDSTAFLWLGLGTSYTLADSTLGSMATFMRLDGGAGLHLPNQVMLWASICTAATLLVAWYVGKSSASSLETFRRLVWGLLVAQIAGAVGLAVGWHVVVGDAAVVVIGVACLAASVGVLSWTTVIPSVSLYFPEEMISAYFTGSACGSLVAGLLGLLQGGWEAFGPTFSMLCVAALLLRATAAWHGLDRAGSGLKRSPTATTAAAAGPSGALAVPPQARGAEGWALLDGGGGGGGGGGVVATKERARGNAVLRPLLLLVVPLNVAVWGIAPNVVQYAAAHAGCSCDADAPAVFLTYQLSISLSYVGMAAAGVVSFVRPTYAPNRLLALGAAQLACFALVAAGASGRVGGLVCGAAARLLFGVATVGMRCADTYVTASAYRVLAARFASDAEQPLLARLSLSLGGALALGTSASSIATSLAVEHDLIGCRLEQIARVNL